ncbi:DEAD/DEAH box helicase [Plesiomonas shigelloides subsp. oncorhynchi]|nr:DEAD/DEAH box helicase [Plesiomonas shigelloides]
MTSFLDSRLINTINNLGYEQPTEIQQMCIPAAITGRDIIASSQTGSGKTMAFLLPMMQRLLRERARQKRDPRAVILAPTRELARQVYAQLRFLLAGKISMPHCCWAAKTLTTKFVRCVKIHISSSRHRVVWRTI